VFRCRTRWPVWFIYLSPRYIRYVVCAEHASLWCKEIDRGFCMLLSDGMMIVVKLGNERVVLGGAIGLMMTLASHHHLLLLLLLLLLLPPPTVDLRCAEVVMGLT
jgi:hypothetical protein